MYRGARKYLFILVHMEYGKICGLTFTYENIVERLIFCGTNRMSITHTMRIYGMVDFFVEQYMDVHHTYNEKIMMES